MVLSGPSAKGWSAQEGEVGSQAEAHSGLEREAGWVGEGQGEEGREGRGQRQKGADSIHGRTTGERC